MKIFRSKAHRMMFEEKLNQTLDSSLQTNQAICKKLQGAKKELQDLVDWALELEKQFDLQHGLGVDAGSGCSIHVCKAIKWLKDNA